MTSEETPDSKSQLPYPHQLSKNTSPITHQPHRDPRYVCTQPHPKSHACTLHLPSGYRIPNTHTSSRHEDKQSQFPLSSLLSLRLYLGDTSRSSHYKRKQNRRHHCHRHSASAGEGGELTPPVRSVGDLRSRVRLRIPTHCWAAWCIIWVPTPD